MKTWLVTGGAGFIGANFIRHILQTFDYRIVNLDCLTYAGNLESLADLQGHPGYLFVRGDIADRSLVAQLLSQYRPDGIVHFAAESHVDRSIDGPGEFIQTNIVGTFQLLEAVRQYWGDLDSNDKDNFRYLQVSTDEVYGSLGEKGLFSETTPFAPNSPYAASKAAADHLVRAYHHTYGLPTLCTHCSNNYGPYQFPEKLMPLMILSALNGKTLPIYGDGKNVRDWLFVEDHCRALVAVLEKANPGEIYNIGGNSEQRNIDVVNAICSILDELQPRTDGSSYTKQIQFVKDRPGHDRRYAIDAGKLYRELGWSPVERFDSGLRKTVQWYLANPKWTQRVSDGSYRGERLGLSS